MAIVTATIAAVAASVTAVSTIGAAVAGAATVSAAVAATASAVVAVSNVIGMIGLVVTAAGAITGNEDLLSAGKIMGYVGLGGSLAGFGVGAAAEGFKAFSSRMGDLYASSWDKGMGKMFSKGADSAGGAAATANQSTQANPGAGVAKASTDPLTAIGGPKPTELTGMTPVAKAGPGVLNTPPPTAAATAPGTVPPNMTDPNAWLNQSVQSATTVKTPVVGVGGAATPAAGAAEPSVMSGFLNNPMMPLAAGQIISGGAGGLFQASATEDQTEMLRQKNERDEAQRQYMNRNNSFAPGTV